MEGEEQENGAAKGSPEAKRRRQEADGQEAQEQDDSLKQLRSWEVLKDSAREKSVFLRGKLRGQDAVVILEKTPISVDALPKILSSSTLSFQMKNDIYSTYQLQIPPDLNELKATVVYPATEKHIKKFEHQASFLVEESSHDYETITLPYIQSHGFSLQWVYNILDHKAEVERIVFEDSDEKLGFILLPDFKWNQKQVEDLYLIAIVHQRNIRSLRDLRAEHLPLLKNILSKGKEAITRCYGLPANQQRVYLHYQPSYYHLHVHFSALGYEAPGCNVERAHLLSHVISNLELNPRHYEKQLLCCPLRADDPLLARFRDAERL